MIVDVAKWVKNVWPRATSRNAVIGDYETIGRLHQFFLADVALRGNVFMAHRDIDNLYTAGKAEGRRELALEILNLAQVRADALRTLIETAQIGDRT